ncbi:outer membrane beta-barrel protein [Bdellovibrio sp. SKB1291214]|uniref:outer membrane beta-barrel protein n=1 Tax=Bdellovibrio sp. SKB1291214 TaxID=1732569 RepID=UPI000B66E70E|nr:outer membrane beta-barrel protein [Bdellovibrio sp. SKB1291214]UYL07498.1 outer membrane beta-barrel protein [Bdellovibrio sp. SKB1291214]
MMKKMWLVLALFLGFSGAAHAGVMIEPYLGYEMGSHTDVNPTAKTELVNMGARLAWTAPALLWLGVDYNLGVSGKYKPDGQTNSDAKRNTLYAVAGIDFPILLRGWIGYGLSSEIKTDSPSDTSFKGKPVKVGVAFTGLPFLSLNFEYIMENLDKSTSGGVDNNSPGKMDSYMLSVSLPLHF